MAGWVVVFFVCLFVFVFFVCFCLFFLFFFVCLFLFCFCLFFVLFCFFVCLLLFFLLLFFFFFFFFCFFCFLIIYFFNFVFSLYTPRNYKEELLQRNRPGKVSRKSSTSFTCTKSRQPSLCVVDSPTSSPIEGVSGLFLLFYHVLKKFLFFMRTV